MYTKLACRIFKSLNPMSFENEPISPDPDTQTNPVDTDTKSSNVINGQADPNGQSFPYFFISSFCEVKKQVQSRMPRVTRQPSNSSTNLTNRHSRQNRNSATTTSNQYLPIQSGDSTEEPHFLVPIPPPITIQEDGGEPWTLHCVCEEKTGIGLLVCCENCGDWQHALCFNLNMHTAPENYLCEICGKKPIRCKCNNNLNYRFSLIQCSQCGYYVHKRCSGFHYGPRPKGDFLCYLCGKSKFKYSKIKLPHSFKFPDEQATVIFNNEKLKSLPSYFLNGPFFHFLTIDIADFPVNVRDFCESFYDRFRSFFFICHPLSRLTLESPLTSNPNGISRKKRLRLFNSFMNGAEQMLKMFYNLDHQQFVTIFDILIYSNLYQSFSEPLEPFDSGLEITENTRFELARMLNIVKLHTIPPPANIQVIPNEGIVALTELQNDQFIMLCDGLVGDLEEFDYDNGISSAFFQIQDTRLVLDTTHVESTPLHHIHRSMEGNVVLKIIQVGDKIHCGLFVGKAGLVPSKSETVQINQGDHLLFGIDFMPAVLEDVKEWISWKIPEIEETNEQNESIDGQSDGEGNETLNNQASGSMSEHPASIHSGPGRKPKSQAHKYKAKKTDATSNANSIAAYNKKSPRSKLKKRNSGQFGQQSTELSLFNLFEVESPCEYLFTVTDDIDEYYKRIEEAQLLNRPHFGRKSNRYLELTSKHSASPVPSPTTAQSASRPTTPHKTAQSPHKPHSRKNESSDENDNGYYSDNDDEDDKHDGQFKMPIRAKSPALQESIARNNAARRSVNEAGKSKHHQVKKEEVTEPPIKDLFRFSDLFQKQLEEAEKIKSHIGLMIGDPIADMKQLLDGD